MEKRLGPVWCGVGKRAVRKSTHGVYFTNSSSRLFSNFAFVTEPDDFYPDKLANWFFYYKVAVIRIGLESCTGRQLLRVQYRFRCHVILHIQDLSLC